MSHWMLRTLQDARAEGWAVAAVNTYDAQQALAVGLSSAACDRPVIVQTAGTSLNALGEAPLVASAVAVRDEFPSRVAVHLDHSSDVEQLRRCLDAGYDSVMIDGSRLALDANIALTRQAVKLVRRYDAWIEAEIGAVAGNEDRSVDAAAGAMTEASSAHRFVEETSVDALAVAVGNVHGMSAIPARLDLDRLEEIAQRVPLPLVLHGASGLPDADIRQAIERGVAKINVNTEVRRAYLDGITSVIDREDAGDDVIACFRAGGAAAAQVVRQKIDLFGRRSASNDRSSS